jgi:hypothetical protein
MTVNGKPILGRSAIRSAWFVAQLDGYERELQGAGYRPLVTRGHLQSVAHFGVWLEQEAIDVEQIDDTTVTAFAHHRTHCSCPRASRNHGRHVVSHVRVFVRYLRQRGCVQAAEPPQTIPLVDAMRGRFHTWTRIRVNLPHVPEHLQPPQESLDPDAAPKISGNSRARSGATTSSNTHAEQPRRQQRQ